MAEPWSRQSVSPPERGTQPYPIQNSNSISAHSNVSMPRTTPGPSCPPPIGLDRFIRFVDGRQVASHTSRRRPTHWPHIGHGTPTEAALATTPDAVTTHLGLLGHLLKRSRHTSYTFGHTPWGDSMHSVAPADRGWVPVFGATPRTPPEKQSRHTSGTSATARSRHTSPSYGEGGGSPVVRRCPHAPSSRKLPFEWCAHCEARRNHRQLNPDRGGRQWPLPCPH